MSHFQNNLKGSIASARESSEGGEFLAIDGMTFLLAAVMLPCWD